MRALPHTVGRTVPSWSSEILGLEYGSRGSSICHAHRTVLKWQVWAVSVTRIYFQWKPKLPADNLNRTLGEDFSPCIAARRMRQFQFKWKEALILSPVLTYFSLLSFQVDQTESNLPQISESRFCAKIIYKVGQLFKAGNLCEYGICTNLLLSKMTNVS